jgi:hypothetical protein
VLEGDRTLFHQRLEMVLGGVGRGKTEGAGDLGARRRHAEDFQAVADEVENLPLAGGQVVGHEYAPLTVFTYSTAEAGTGKDPTHKKTPARSGRPMTKVNGENRADYLWHMPVWGRATSSMLGPVTYTDIPYAGPRH